ncbi:MAG: glycine zipper 2TM domain-containing protein [Pseudomonadota bacterium]|jgi:uncharacterized protein YcfJ
MNRSLVTGIVIGAAVAATAGAIGGYRLLGPAQPEFAEVLAVTEATTEVPVSREVCRDVPVTRRKPVKDQHQILGTVAGAVLGGVAGSQIGGGSGKKIATAAGAIAGGVAGKKTQENIQAGATYTTTERRCETVQETRTEVIGYDVRYRLGEREGEVRMSHRPGERIPVRDGELVLEPQAPSS